MGTKKIVEVKNFELSTFRYDDQYIIKFNDGAWDSIYLSLSELLKLLITEGLSMEEIIVLWEKDRSISFKKATIYIFKESQNGKPLLYAGSDAKGVCWEKARKSFLHEVDVELLNKIMENGFFNLFL